MLYLMSLKHSPDQCPGVAHEIRDRVMLAASTMTAHLTFILLDGPNAHAVDDAAVDLGLAVWNTNTIYPVITFEEAVGGLPQE